MNTRAWLGLLTTLLLIATAVIVFLGSSAEEQPSACDYDIITCTNDSSCGESGFYGEPFCQEGDVWQPYYLTRCIHAGTCESSCQSQQTTRLVQECTSGCLQGSCT